MEERTTRLLPRDDSWYAHWCHEIKTFHSKIFSMKRSKIILTMPHLSKRISDLKQKCTQLLTPFSGMVFHALSHDGIHFAWSVSFELNRSSWLAVREFPPVRKWFLGLTPQAKQITPCERAWNTVPENTVRDCVHFCLQPLLWKDVMPLSKRLVKKNLVGSKTRLCTPWDSNNSVGHNFIDYCTVCQTSCLCKKSWQQITTTI